ncbi:MAG: hypothetical protein JSV01_04200, partial [Desulfobacterales bacterium]
VVKLTGLADNNRAGTDDHDPGYVRPFWHRLLLPNHNSVYRKSLFFQYVCRTRTRLRAKGTRPMGLPLRL